MNTSDIKEVAREKYRQAAPRAKSGGNAELIEILQQSERNPSQKKLNHRPEGAVLKNTVALRRMRWRRLAQLS
jgi:hypothetical protein